MRFIRQNLFLIVLISATLISAVVIVLIDSGISGDIEANLVTRRNLSENLRGLSRGPQINAVIVEAERKRVRDIKTAAADVLQRSIAWNKRNFQILSFWAGEGAERRQIKAFPFKPEIYRTIGTFNVTDQFVKEFAALRNSLQPTAPPSEGEVNDEIKRIERQLQEEEMIASSKRTAATLPAGTDAVRGGAAGLAISVAAELTARAQREGKANAILQKSRAGLMYVSKEAFDKSTPSEWPVDLVSKTDLWRAQVSLWVATDLIKAINDTNTQSLQAPGGQIKTRCVENAAIKQLDKLVVANNYYLGEGSVVVSGGGPKSGLPGLPPGGGPPAGGSDTPVSSLAGPAVSQRATCPDYSVVRYELVVVMPTRHLTALERNLALRNYHTILNVEVQALGEHDRYYYGTEPVSRIVLQGEILLLSGWERQDSPVEVLAQLPDKALRPEDRQRIQKEGSN